MQKYCLAVLSLFILTEGSAQEISDSTEITEVIVQGFETNRRLMETPVSASFVGKKQLGRYSNITMVNAINASPGVRMEERSPGSYRLSIRGSLLRSPFGVRNVKVYWNDIPFTDAGGNTYFNLVDQNSVDQLEILKGPAASLYGANTGGAVLIQSANSFSSVPSNTIGAGLTGGSYGTFKENLQWKYQNNKFSSTLTQSHLQADGYRENTAMRRDIMQWNGAAKLDSSTDLSWILLYTNMQYRTPGGLTLQQLQENPKQARPRAGNSPGAVEQKAGIYNKTPLAGVQLQKQISQHFNWKTSAMFSHTSFTNPFITNYETRSETNTGLRSSLGYQKSVNQHHFNIRAGMEWLYSYSYIQNYDNNGGTKGEVQLRDKLWASQLFPFFQSEWNYQKIFLQAGVSSNFFNYRYKQITGDNQLKKNPFNEAFTPRVAALYAAGKNVSLHGSVSKGFSAPSMAEVRPSDGNIYPDLRPESGWNYEMGFRGTLWNEKLQFDVTAYQFRLQNAIVRRLNDAGAEYFTNAGGTTQKGIESFLQYYIIKHGSQFIHQFNVWSSLTFNRYRFNNYKVGQNDFSGNALTGVPAWVSSAGVGLETTIGFFLQSTYAYVNKTPLNDGSTWFAPHYHLATTKLGWRMQIKNVGFSFHGGADIAFNTPYSLGVDINAFGNRYFNPSAPSFFYGGLTIKNIW